MLKKTLIFFALTLVLTGCGTTKTDTEAQKALTDFFSYLRQGNYAKAATLYAGSDDLAQTCQLKDSHCYKVKRIVSDESKLLGGREMTVEFVTPSGALYANSGKDGLQTQFVFTVKKDGDTYKVE